METIKPIKFKNPDINQLLTAAQFIEDLAVSTKKRRVFYRHLSQGYGGIWISYKVNTAKWEVSRYRTRYHKYLIFSRAYTTSFESLGAALFSLKMSERI